MFKKILVTLLLGTSVNYIQSMFPPEQLEAIENHTCIGSLSAENQKFIDNIMHEMDIVTSVKIRRPHPTLAEIYPVFNFQLYNPLYQIWYIDEPWFNTLSPDERTFMVSHGLATIQGGFKKQIVTQSAIIATNILTQLALWYSSYKHITSYPTILNISDNSPTKSFIISAGAIALFSRYVTNPLTVYSMHKVYIAHTLKIDQKVIQQFNCAEGALSYLKKMEQTIKPLYEQDTMYWKYIYESFAPRIKDLEKSLNITCS